jgi:hypothetical protein
MTSRLWSSGSIASARGTRLVDLPVTTAVCFGCTAPAGARSINLGSLRSGPRLPEPYRVTLVYADVEGPYAASPL